MDGAGVAAVLTRGASAAQLGTAFIACPEFGAVEAALRKYVDSLVSYKKNKFPELAAEMRQRIGNAASPVFANGTLFILTEGHLYAIGGKP